MIKYFYIFILGLVLFSSIMACGGGASPSATPAPSSTLSAQNCGNALLNENESCDDGNTNNSDGCNANCAWEVGEAICGNGVLENEECCEDGNTVSGDGCSSACTKEAVNRPPSAPLLATEPANGATWAPTRLYLSWNPSTDADVGDQVVYDVYFVEGNGISPTAFPYKKGITETNFIIQASTDNRAQFFPDVVRLISLQASHTYTWKICARDRLNVSSCSEQRIFNTDDSVVGWWRFDENPAGSACPAILGGSAGDVGETVCDYSGKGNHGKNYGTPTWISPNSTLLGAALQFDGVDDWVEVANSVSLNPSPQISLEVSQKLLALGGLGTDRRFVSKITSQEAIDNTGYLFGFGFGNDWSLNIGNVGGVGQSSLSVLDVWYRLVGIYDGINGKTYSNGIIVNTVPFVGTINSNTQPLWIGRTMRFNSFYNGIISEVIIYSKAIAGIEVLNSFQASH